MHTTNLLFVLYLFCSITYSSSNQISINQSTNTVHNPILMIEKAQLKKSCKNKII